MFGLCRKQICCENLFLFTGEKISKCQLCDAMFENASQRRQHMKDSHKVGFSCSICGHLCVSQYKLSNHIQNQHVLSENRTSCYLCKLRLANVKELQQHLVAFHNIGNEVVDRASVKHSSIPVPVSCVETQHLMAQDSNINTSQHIIYVDSSDIENTLQSDEMAMVVYLCPPDVPENSEIIAAMDDLNTAPNNEAITPGDLNTQKNTKVISALDNLNTAQNVEVISPGDTQQNTEVITTEGDLNTAQNNEVITPGDMNTRQNTAVISAMDDLNAAQNTEVIAPRDLNTQQNTELIIVVDDFNTVKNDEVITAVDDLNTARNTEKSQQMI